MYVDRRGQEFRQGGGTQEEEGRNETNRNWELNFCITHEYQV